MPTAKSSNKAVKDIRKGAGRPGGKKVKSPKKKVGRKAAKKAAVEEMLEIDAAPLEEVHFEDLFPEGNLSASTERGDSKMVADALAGATGSGQINMENMDALEQETAGLEDDIFDGEDILPQEEVELLVEPETTAEDQDDMDFAQIQESMPKEIPAETPDTDEAEAAPKVPKAFFDQILDNLKVNRKVVKRPEEEKREICNRLIERMRQAAQDDVDSIRLGGVAAHKLRMLDQVNKFLSDTSWHEAFVMNNGVHVIGVWLQLLPNNVRPNMTLERNLLRLLTVLPISTDKLKQSGVGRIIRDIAKDPHTGKDSRIVAQELITKWMRNVFSQSTSYARKYSDDQDWASRAGKKEDFVQKPAKSKEQIREEAKISNARRHPEMFQKPSIRFVVAPEVEVEPAYERGARGEDGGRGVKHNIKSKMGGLRATSEKVDYHLAPVSIGGGGLNITFGKRK